MYDRYLSRFCVDELLYMDMDSMVVFHDETNKSHIMLPIADLLGDLKDEYGDLLASNPSWCMGKFIAFGPQMYQLIFKDKVSGRIMKWMKMMKGISMKGNVDMFSGDKLHVYRNPMIDFCSILQYGSSNEFLNMTDIRAKMLELRCLLDGHGRDLSCEMSVSITFNQNVFKGKLSHVFTNEIIMSQPIQKQVRVTQCKRFPKPNKDVPFGEMFPIGWR